MKEEINELIVVEQLPIIRYKLEQLKVEIQEKVDNAKALVVNEDTVKEVKGIRADLNKEFTQLEESRKAVKKAIMSKYDEFEEIYKENVSNLYKQADSDLKTKIDNVENQLKYNKEFELKEFFEEQARSYEILDYVNFNEIGLNITLSASMKSLKEQIIEYCEKIVKDIKLIELEDNSDEIMLEYTKCKDYIQAKAIVLERHKQLEQLKQKQEEQTKEQEIKEEMIQKVEEVTIPKVIEEEQEQIFEVTFTCKGTKEQLKSIKQFLIENNIEYK